VLGPGFLDYFIHGGPIAVLGAADAMVVGIGADQFANRFVQIE